MSSIYFRRDTPVMLDPGCRGLTLLTDHHGHGRLFCSLPYLHPVVLAVQSILRNFGRTLSTSFCYASRATFSVRNSMDGETR